MTKKPFLILAGMLLLIGIVGVASYAIIDTREKSTPDDVASRFYSRWISAVEAGKAPEQDPEFVAKSTYVTPGLARTLRVAAERGQNPVLCSSDVPREFSLAPARMNEERGQASVDMRTEIATGRVYLIQDEKGWWRIDEIECELLVPSSTDSAATSTVPQ